MIWMMSNVAMHAVGFLKADEAWTVANRFTMPIFTTVWTRVCRAIVSHCKSHSVAPVVVDQDVVVNTLMPHMIIETTVGTTR